MNPFQADQFSCPMGTPMGNPMGNPMGTPMGTPLGIPMGTPMGTPTCTPMGSPMGTPMCTPMCTPMYTPMCTPMGSLMGTPMCSPMVPPMGDPNASFCGCDGPYYHGFVKDPGNPTLVSCTGTYSYTICVPGMAYVPVSYYARVATATPITLTFTYGKQFATGCPNSECPCSTYNANCLPDPNTACAMPPSGWYS